MLHFLDRLIHAMSEAALVIDQRGAVVAANEAAVDLFDLPTTPAELRSHGHPAELMSGWNIEGVPFVAEQLRRSLQGQTIPRQLATITTAAGVEHTIEFTTTPIYDEQDQTTLAMLIASDVTREQRGHAYWQTIATAAQGLSAEMNVERVVETVLDEIVEALGGRVVIGLWKWDEAEQGLILMDCRGLRDENAELLHSLSLDCPSFICEAARTQQIRYVEDTRKAPAQHDLDRRLIEDEKIGSWVAAPLIVGGCLIGVMSYGMLDSARFYEEDLLAITTVSGLFAIAIDHAYLYQASQARGRELHEASEEIREINQQLIVSGLREQRLSEEAEASRERISNILESITDAFLAVDREWRITYVNKQAELPLRMSRAELMGKKLWDVFPGAVGTTFFTEYHRAVAERTTVEFEEFYAPFNIWFEVRGYPFQDGLAVYFRDITQRKRLDEELRSANQSLRIYDKIVNNSPDLILVLNREYEIINVNPAYCQFRQVTADQILGRAVPELVRRELFKDLIRPKLDLCFAGEVVTYEAWFPFDVPGPRYMEASYYPLVGDGTVDSVVAILRDRTEIRRVQDEIVRLASIVQSSEDAIISKTMEGIITSWNPGAERLYGYTAEEVLGKSVSIIIPPDRPDELTHILERIRREEKIDHYDTVRVRKDGTRVDVSATVSSIKDATGQVAGISTIARDITERKLAEEFREQYVHTVSHDLRSPLTSVLGQAQLIQRSPDRVDLVRRSADSIVTAAGRMNRLIQDLVDSARFEGGQLQLDKQRTNLGSFVPELLERAGSAIDTARIRVDIPSDLPPVAADHDRLERLLLNLLSNSLRYSPPEADVLITARSADGEVLTSVADHGIGISPQDLSHIFERFYRAAGSRKAEGVGLGLYIARLLVGAHGGRLWATSEPGKGSTFYFTLPEA